MSLPAFSPPNQTFLGHHDHYQQQPFTGTNVFHDEVPPITSSISSAIDDFNLDEDFSLDLAGAASSEDDGMYLIEFRIQTIQNTNETEFL
jgi:hypothetical protein